MMASLPDMSEFDQHNKPYKKPKKIDLALEDLEANNPERAASLRAALTNYDYSATAVASVMRSWGFSLDASSVRNWRRDNET